MHRYIIIHYSHEKFGDIPHCLKRYEMERNRLTLKFNIIPKEREPYYANFGERKVSDSIGYSFFNSPIDVYDGLEEKDLPELLQKYPNLKLW